MVFYTPDWQIEQLNIDAALKGHDFTLSLLAADCEPTGHYGYAYLDGFSSALVDPAATVPVPGSLALVAIGSVGLWTRSRQRTQRAQAKPGTA